MRLFKTLDRALLREVVPPFLLGLLAFTVLMTGALLLRPTLDFMVEYNVPLAMAGKVFLLGLPQVFAYTIPMSMLLGTLIAFGRLSSDEELTAMRAAGYGLIRIILPVFLLGLVLSVAAFLLNEKVAVHASRQVKEIKNEVITRQTGAVEQEDLLVEFQDEDSRTSWVLKAEDLKGDRLTGVHLFYIGREIEDSWWLQAPEAHWTGNDWRFSRATMTQRRADGSTVTSQHEELNIEELDLTSEQMALETLSSSERDFWEQLEYVKSRAPTLPEQKVLKELTELYMKLSTPFSTAFFVLLAVPLGIIPQRTTTTTGFGIALFLVLGYYAVMITCIRLAQAGTLPPLLASVLPNTAVFLVGAALIWWRMNS